MLTTILSIFFFIVTGDNVNLDHAYIWNNVHIASNVVISQSVVCDKVEVKTGVTLNKQCVLAYNVSNMYYHSLIVTNQVLNCECAVLFVGVNYKQSSFS